MSLRCPWSGFSCDCTDRCAYDVRYEEVAGRPHPQEARHAARGKREARARARFEARAQACLKRIHKTRRTKTA